MGASLGDQAFMRAHFLSRVARLGRLHREYLADGLPRERVDLLAWVLYSTLGDCARLGISAQARAAFARGGVLSHRARWRPPGIGRTLRPTGGPPYCSPGPYAAWPGSALAGLAAAGPAFPATASLTDPASAALSWSAVPGAVSYTVLLGVNGAPLTPWGSVAGTVAVVPLGQAGATYVFQVQAQDAAGVVVVSSTLTPPLTAGGTAAGTGGVTASGVPSAATSQLVGPTGPVSLAASPGGIPLTVQLRDSQNLPLAGVPVTLTASPPGATITPAPPITDGGGTATALVLAPAGTTVTVAATVAGVPLAPAVLSIAP
jgi:hypothetical protein